MTNNNLSQPFNGLLTNIVLLCYPVMLFNKCKGEAVPELNQEPHHEHVSCA